jgi:hypothetical protein
VKKIYNAMKAECQFCRIQHARLMEFPEYDIWNIARAEVNWWKFWDGDSNDDLAEDDSFSLRKDFGIRYLVPNDKPFPEEYFVTKHITEDEASECRPQVPITCTQHAAR